jgi:hypothetical protein
MTSLATISTWRARWALLVALLAGGVLHVHGAVMPIATDAPGGGAGLRSGLLVPAMEGVAGEWVGHTSTGGRVALVLRVDHGVVEGDATLEGVVPEGKSGPRPLVGPTVSGRTIAFAVQPGPCAKSLALGVVTFMSAERAQLDLHAGSSPITVRLNKVG